MKLSVLLCRSGRATAHKTCLPLHVRSISLSVQQAELRLCNFILTDVAIKSQ